MHFKWKLLCVCVSPTADVIYYEMELNVQQADINDANTPKKRKVTQSCR